MPVATGIAPATSVPLKSVTASEAPHNSEERARSASRPAPSSTSCTSSERGSSRWRTFGGLARCGSLEAVGDLRAELAQQPRRRRRERTAARFSRGQVERPNSLVPGSQADQDATGIVHLRLHRRREPDGFGLEHPSRAIGRRVAEEFDEAIRAGQRDRCLPRREEGVQLLGEPARDGVAAEPAGEQPIHPGKRARTANARGKVAAPEAVEHRRRQLGDLRQFLAFARLVLVRRQALHVKRPDRLAVEHHRHRENGQIARVVERGNGEERRIFADVGEEERLAAGESTAADALSGLERDVADGRPVQAMRADEHQHARAAIVRIERGHFDAHRASDAVDSRLDEFVGKEWLAAKTLEQALVVAGSGCGHGPKLASVCFGSVSP